LIDTAKMQKEWLDESDFMKRHIKTAERIKSVGAKKIELDCDEYYRLISMARKGIQND